jgi:hypothetical protein
MREPLYIECSDLCEYQGSGKFRSFSFYAFGHSIDELIKNADILEVDQDGGEISCYGLDDASNDVYQAAIGLINAEFKKWSNVQ